MHKTEKYGILIGNVKQSLWPHYDPVHPLVHIPHQEPSCPTHQTQKKEEEEERNDHRLSLANGHVYVRAIKPFSFTPELQGLSEAFCMSFRFVSNQKIKNESTPHQKSPNVPCLLLSLIEGCPKTRHQSEVLVCSPSNIWPHSTIPEY